jgi:DNA repair exonuclease SbcCD nuclease subunit
MTKIAFITDTHYGVRNDNHNFYDYQKKANDFFFKTIKERGIDTIIHGGDLVDRRKYVNYLTASRLRNDLLEPMKDFEVHLICGNHDVYYRDRNDVNSLDVLLGGYDNITYYTKPDTINIKGQEVFFLPWIAHGKEDEASKAISSTPAKVCFGHLEITGFEYLKGVECHDGLDRDIFGSFSRVYTGHFHHPSDNGHIFYTGAAYQFDWGDYVGRRGFTIIDLENHSLECIENPYSLFASYTYDDKEKKEQIEMDLKNGAFSSMKDNYVRVYVDDKADPNLLRKVIEAIENAEPIDLKIIDNTVFEGVQVTLDDTKVDDTPSTIRRYISSMNYETNVEKPVQKFMEELYNEAVSMETVD